MYKLSKENVLVTGSNGLLGKQLILNLPREKYNIFAVVKEKPKHCVDHIEYLEIDLASNW